jgi:hypothetical protein
MPPVATETHLCYSARQMRSWSEVFNPKARPFEYQVEETCGDDNHHHARLAANPEQDQIELYQGAWWGLDDSDDERNDTSRSAPTPTLVTVPLVKTERECWLLTVVADQKSVALPPLLVTLTRTPRQVGLWHAVTGVLLAVSAPPP